MKKILVTDGADFGKLIFIRKRVKIYDFKVF